MSEEEENFWDKLARLDRRVIYWAIFLALIIPHFTVLGLPVVTEPYVKDAYETMEALPEGSLVLYWVEGSAGMWPDVLPACEAVMYHIYKKHLKFVVIAGGYSVDFQITMKKVWDAVGYPEEWGYEYGKDWAYFGFFPGAEAGFAMFARDIRSVYKTDVYGNPIDSLEIMKNVNSAADFDLGWVFVYGSGWEWIQKHWTIAFGTPNCYATVGAITPEKASYYWAGTNAGALGGVRDTAAYEKLVGRLAWATKKTDTLNIGLLLGVFWVILGNIAYFARGRRR